MAEPAYSISTTYGSRYDNKSEMSKSIERWTLFQYVHGELTPLSKPFKTREQARRKRARNILSVCARGLDSV